MNRARPRIHRVYARCRSAGAGACGLSLALARFPSAASAAAGRITIVSDGVLRRLASEAGPGHGLANGDVNSAKLVWDFFRPFGG
ncbi:MAG: hypothetical protein ACT4O2_12395 [Beijerinckiaceae bacterium]